MQPARPHALKQWTTIVTIVLLCAAGVTWLQTMPGMALNPVRNWLQGPASEPAPVPQPAPTVAQQPTKVEPQPVQAQPTPAAATAAAPKKAVTVSYVNVRSGKSTSTAIIANLEAGTEVELRDDANSTWQGVTVQGKNGYIYKEYLQLH